jgi:hypothetical protein
VESVSASLEEAPRDGTFFEVPLAALDDAGVRDVFDAEVLASSLVRAVERAKEPTRARPIAGAVDRVRR